jgi:hypothetical protein
MAVNLKYIPVEVSISAEQERELFAEFQPLLYLAAATLVNVAKEQSFVKFAFLAKVLGLAFDEAHNSMIWPD